MYDHIKGYVTYIETEHVVVQVQGIGFLVSIPYSLFLQGLKEGEELLLYTSLVVREQSHTLFGFIARAERSLFETLLTISGIGPKTALNLIGHLGGRELQEAVRSSSSRAIVGVPGVGKKTAERLLIDLRGKIEHLTWPGVSLVPTDGYQEALRALTGLGFSEQQAHQALHKAKTEGCSENNLPQLLSVALRVSRDPVRNT